MLKQFIEELANFEKEYCIIDDIIYETSQFEKMKFYDCKPMEEKITTNLKILYDYCLEHDNPLHKGLKYMLDKGKRPKHKENNKFSFFKELPGFKCIPPYWLDAVVFDKLNPYKYTYIKTYKEIVTNLSMVL